MHRILWGSCPRGVPLFYPNLHLLRLPLAKSLRTRGERGGGRQIP